MHHALKYGMPNSSVKLSVQEHTELKSDPFTRNPGWVLETSRQAQRLGKASRCVLDTY